MNDNEEPGWVNLFFYGAGLSAALALIAALLFGGSAGPLAHGPGVADITINLSGIPVREHCTTCHIQGGLPNVEAHGGRVEFHPDIAPHSVQNLGCTGCHLGEGMALDPEISHGLPGLEARRILKGKEVQARCYACHELNPLPGAERAWQGYVLFRTRACDTCHRISGNGIGGRFGPDLGTIGSHLGLEPLKVAIRDPKRDPPNSIMPRFPLSRGQARDIAFFLKSRVKDPLYATPMQIMAGIQDPPVISMPIPEDLPSKGHLLSSRKCLACHKFGLEDGRIGTDLSAIGAMREREYISVFLTDPSKKIPGAIMPRVKMTAGEEKEIVNFLASRATKPSPVSGANASGYDQEGKEAKHLYMTLCQRCHAASGDGRGLIQPNLANFPRPFAGNAEFFRVTPDQRIVSSIEKGIAGTSMPPYGNLLDKNRSKMLIDLLFEAFIGIPRTEKTTMPPLPVAAEAPSDSKRAETRYMEYCSRCHGRYGTGKGPEYLDFQPRPRNLTNEPYFAAINDERIARAIADGIPGTAMPAFREELSAEDLWGLAALVRRFSAGEVYE